MSTNSTPRSSRSFASVTAAMGLDARRPTIEETPDNIRLNLTGDGAEVLLRRKGEALDALQVIVNTAFRRDARGDRHYVDRRARLPARTRTRNCGRWRRFLIEKAKTTGTPQEIGPAQSVRAPHRAPDRLRRPMVTSRASATRS